MGWGSWSSPTLELPIGCESMLTSASPDCITASLSAAFTPLPVSAGLDWAQRTPSKPARAIHLCSFLLPSSWLEEEDDPVVARVNRRMQHITGLTVKTAELLQVGWSLGLEDLGGVLWGEVVSQGAQASREGSSSPRVIFLMKGPDGSHLTEGRSASAHSFSPLPVRYREA